MPQASRRPYSTWTCRTWSAPCSNSRDARPTESWWHSLLRSECRLSSVTSQSRWELRCSCCRSCRHSLPWGSVGSGGTGHSHTIRGRGLSTLWGRGLSTWGSGSGALQPRSLGQGPASSGSLALDMKLMWGQGAGAQQGQAAGVLGSTLEESVGHTHVHPLTKQGQHRLPRGTKYTNSPESLDFLGSGMYGP